MGSALKLMALATGSKTGEGSGYGSGPTSPVSGVSLEDRSSVQRGDGLATAIATINKSGPVFN